MSAVSDAVLKIAIGRLVAPDRIRFQLEAEFGCSLADKVDLIRECLPPPPPPPSLPPALYASAYGLHGSASGSSSYQHAQSEPHPAPPARSSSNAAAAAASALLSVSTPPLYADSPHASAGPRFVPSAAAPQFIHHPRQQSSSVLEAPFALPVMPLPTSSAAFGVIGQSPHRPYVCNIIPEAASHARAPQLYQQPAIQHTVTQEELHARRGYTVDRDRSAFMCEICQHGCVSGNDLNRHRAEVHLNKHRFACDLCAYRCARNSALRDHKLARHANHSTAHDEFSRSAS